MFRTDFVSLSLYLFIIPLITFWLCRQLDVPMLLGWWQCTGVPRCCLWPLPLSYQLCFSLCLASWTLKTYVLPQLYTHFHFPCEELYENLLKRTKLYGMEVYSVCLCALGVHAVPEGHKHAVFGRPDGSRRCRGLEFAQTHRTASSDHRRGAACPVSACNMCVIKCPLSRALKRTKMFWHVHGDRVWCKD